MPLIDRLQENLGFTRNEIKVVLFLAFALIAGAAVQRLLSPGRQESRPEFSSTAMDRAFAERSAATPASPAPPAGMPLQRTERTLSVNINTAGREELLRLPGIGPAYADRILRYRREHGPFARVNDLDAVRGIGPKTLARLRPYVRVR